MTEQETQNSNAFKLDSGIILYWLTLGLILIASFLPEARVWGLGPYAYLPSFFSIVIILLLAVVPLLIQPIQKTLSNEKLGYYPIAVPFVLILSAAFYFLKAKTFFLGDGYQRIDNFVNGISLSKSYAYGTNLIHDNVLNLFSGQPAEIARSSYQSVSIVAGLITLAILIYFSRKLFEQNLHRVLFLLGSATGGYMLLFFGYIENHALLIMSLMLYVLIGLQVAQAKMNKWQIILQQIILIFVHAIGFCFIPATLYLIFADSKSGKKFAAMETVSKLLTILIVAIVGIAIMAYYYQTSLSFRFALVPPLANKFTVEGYTLFSMAHLTDMANLLFILFPGFLLLLPLLKKTNSLSDKRPIGFLAIAVVSSLLAIFIFDPRLGMPREWSLFAFAGIPLVLGGFYFLLSITENHNNAISTAILSIVLALALLFPRAVVLATPDYGVNQMVNYVDLDKIKNRAGRGLVIKYLRDNDQSDGANYQLRLWQDDFPEVQLAINGAQLSREGNLAEAILLNQQAISINPIFWVSYSNIGTYYNSLGQYDSATAYFEIANGLNPNNSQLLNNLGFALTQLTRFDQAEDCFQACIDLEPNAMAPILNMMQLYKSSGQTDKFNVRLFKVAQMDNAPAAVFKELGDYYLQRGDFDLAKPAYDTSLFLGMDSAVILELRQNFPQLAE